MMNICCYCDEENKSDHVYQLKHDLILPDGRMLSASKAVDRLVPLCDDCKANLNNALVEQSKYYELDSFYKYGSHGYYRLWGDEPTIKKSKFLIFGWGLNMNDDEPIHYQTYDWNEQGDCWHDSKKKLLAHWNDEKRASN